MARTEMLIGGWWRHLRYPPDGDRGVATYNPACRFALDPGALGRARHEVLGVPFDLQAPAYLTALERVRGAAELGRARRPTSGTRGGRT